MAYKPKFFGKVRIIKGVKRFVMNGEEEKHYLMHIDRYKEDEDMEATFSKKHKPRTTGAPGEETNFNGYLWGVVYKIIGDEIGEVDLDKIHEWAQLNVGNFDVMPDGKHIPKGTSHMSGGEFSEYCSRVRTWAGTPGEIVEHGLFIPEPNEVDYE